MAKLLITGSLGVIGKALLATLPDNFTAVRFDLRYPSDTAAHGDIRDYAALTRSMQGCEGVIHLAAIARVGEGEHHPALCWDTNVNGTQHLLQAALSLKKSPWVLFASSREVYGQQVVLPVQESAPLQPLNLYARSKAKAEGHCLQAQKQGLNVAILRFANVFGPIDDYPTRVIPAFCRAALQGQPLQLQGPHNIFDLIYIDDITRGILKVVAHLCAQKDALPPLQLTTGVGTQNKALARMICQLAHSSSPLLEAPARSCDIRRFYGDATMTQHLLAWKPQVTLRAGIQKLLKEMQTTLNSKQGGHYESP